MFLNILVLLESTQSADNVFLSFTIMCESEYFLTLYIFFPH